MYCIKDSKTYSDCTTETVAMEVLKKIINYEKNSFIINNCLIACHFICKVTKPTPTANSEATPPHKESAGKDTGKTPANTIKEEVACYKSSTLVEDKALARWRSSTCKCPHTAMMARCYPTVPSTSLHSERVFSTAGDSDIMSFVLYCEWSLFFLLV